MSYLRAYSFHGVYCHPQNSKDAIGDCPFCGTSDHFSVHMSTGMFRCFVCGTKGNLYVFLRRKWEKLLSDFWSDPRLAWKRLKSLAAERGISSHVLKDRGMVYDADLRHWVLPIFAPARNSDGTLNLVAPRKLVNLKRWVRINGKRYLHGTFTCATHLYDWDRVAYERLPAMAASDLVPSNSRTNDGNGLSGVHSRLRLRILVAEGEWDGLALAASDFAVSETVRPTIVSVPGTDSCKPEWLEFLYSELGPDTEVVWLFDNDDAGILGYESLCYKLRLFAGWQPTAQSPDALARIVDRLGRLAERTRFLVWPKDRPDGYDIRDLCRELNHDGQAVLDYLEPCLKRRKIHVEA